MNTLTVTRDGILVASASLTDEELAAWGRYADSHGWLLAADYGRTLEMFLSHFRRGININDR